MRHFIASIAVALSFFLLPTAHTTANAAGNPKVVLVTDYSPIEFTFPAGWHRNKEANPYELHAFSKDEDLVTGVFVFRKEDLTTSKPLDILDQQVKDMQGKRKNFKVHEPLAKYERGDLALATVTYTGEKDSSKYCYRFTLIQFKSDPSKFAVVLQVSFPEDWKDVKPILEEITNSAKPLKALRTRS